MPCRGKVNEFAKQGQCYWQSKSMGLMVKVNAFVRCSISLCCKGCLQSEQRVVALPASDNWQGDAVNLLVDVQGIDIGHAADVVNHGHDARFEVRTLYVVLTAEPPHELLRIETVGVDGRLDERLHECLHDFITRQLHIQHGFAVVDALVRQFCALPVCLAL